MRVENIRIPLGAGIFIFLLPLLLSLCAEESGEEIRLYVGEPRILSVTNPTRIVIGNPAVADVTSATKNEITISPKSRGVTSLVVWDAFGEQSYRVKVFSENLDEIKNRIDTLLKTLEFSDVYTRVAEDEGKILLLGRVKYPQNREKITLALGPLKDKTVDLIEIKEEETAVEIDVQLLELDKDATKTLGLSWPASITLTESNASPALATTALQQVGTTETITGGDAVGTKWSTLFKVLSGSRAAFSVKLDALIQEGKARILSRPRLSCQSGKEAELLVGGEKPILTTNVSGTSGASGSSVEYKEYGIKLKIKPIVTAEERIKLAVKVEVSEVGEAETLGAPNSPTARAYPLTKRTAATELSLNDGDAMAIGGLMREKFEEDIRKTPFLGDLPILGMFFRQRVTKVGGGSAKRENTELFIILTPQLKRVKEGVFADRKSSDRITDSAIAEQPYSEIAKYAGIIKTRIMANLTYPTSAKNAGLQGTVRLKMHLNYNGELTEAVIDTSSGYKVLDDNALAVAEEISFYPPFPPGIENKDLWVSVPITYQLD